MIQSIKLWFFIRGRLLIDYGRKHGKPWIIRLGFWMAGGVW